VLCCDPHGDGEHLLKQLKVLVSLQPSNPTKRCSTERNRLQYVDDKRNREKTFLGNRTAEA